MSIQDSMRLDPDGAPGAGMAPTAYVDPATVLEGKAVEKGHTFFASKDGRFLVGVWECSPCRERIDSYPFNEFCQVLKGAVTVTDAAGRSETYRAGDSFFMPKGFRGIWHMTETFRKYFVIYGGD